MVENEARSIAIFLPHLEGGGVERMALNLAQEFVNRNIDVFLVLVQKRGRLLAAIPTEVQVIDLDATNLLIAIPRLASVIRMHKPNVVFSGITSVNFASILASYLVPAPPRVVVSERILLSKNIRTHPLKKLFPLLMQILYTKAWKIIAVSYGVAADLQVTADLPSDHIQVIYNPVISKQFLEDAQLSNDHPWMRNDSNYPVVVGVGRLVEQKDFSTLIHAFHEVLENRKAHLIILGEGEQRPRLEELVHHLKIEDWVHLPGYTTNPGSYLTHASVFVLSSIYEGFGNVIVEALACGTSVVSTDCPSGPAEILNDGEFGILVPIGDASSMAAGILQLLDEPITESALRARAQNFSVETITDEYLQVMFD